MIAHPIHSFGIGKNASNNGVSVRVVAGINSDDVGTMFSTSFIHGSDNGGEGISDIDASDVNECGDIE